MTVAGCSQCRRLCELGRWGTSRARSAPRPSQLSAFIAAWPPDPGPAASEPKPRVRLARTARGKRPRCARSTIAGWSCCRRPRQHGSTPSAGVGAASTAHRSGPCWCARRSRRHVGRTTGPGRIPDRGRPDGSSIRARRSGRNTGPVFLPFSRHGSNLAVAVRHTMTSASPPLRRAQRLRRSSSSTSRARISSARAAVSYSIRHRVRSPQRQMLTGQQGFDVGTGHGAGAIRGARPTPDAPGRATADPLLSAPPCGGRPQRVQPGVDSGRSGLAPTASEPPADLLHHRVVVQGRYRVGPAEFGDQGMQGVAVGACGVAVGHLGGGLPGDDGLPAVRAGGRG